MASIYLAALYSDMKQMRRVADNLKVRGHEVTARWINGDEKGQTPEQAALMDIADIDYAKIFLFFALEKGALFTGGGRYVEFGYAYATHKRIMVIGPKGENVFHYLPSIEHYATLEDALGAL